MTTRPAAPPPSSQHQLDELPEGWRVLRHAILRDGTLAAVGTEVTSGVAHQGVPAPSQMARLPLGPASQVDERAGKGAGRVWIATASGWADGPTYPVEAHLAAIDRFSDGRWLVVEARTPTGAGNARVLGADGQPINRFELGDAVEHAAIDSADRIWVGWSDEGVFGNADWRVPGREEAPSSSGVACFSDDGVCLPLAPWPEGAGMFIDCYALSSTRNGTWVCAHSGFPLVHFNSGGPTRWWRNVVNGV